jgi:hypothetical protein
LAEIANALGSLALWFVWYVVLGLFTAVVMSLIGSGDMQPTNAVGFVVTVASAAALALLPRLLAWWPSLSRWCWRWGIAFGMTLVVGLVVGLAVPGLLPALMRPLIAASGIDAAARGVSLIAFLAILVALRPPAVPRAEQALQPGAPEVGIESPQDRRAG